MKQQTTQIDFLSKSKIAYVVSILGTALAVWVWISQGDSKYGTDFTGGSEFIVRVEGGASSQAVRDALSQRGVPEATVQAFDSTDQFSVRVGSVGDSEQLRKQVEDALSAAFGGKGSILQADVVGPTIGKELKQAAFLSVIVGLLGILVYVTFRFEFAYGLGALVALFHDVVIATGGYLLAGHTLNMSAVAAALTIIGYSVNDTIVIFDRVREERKKHPHEPLPSIINDSVNAMLGRTLVTTGLTLASAVALLLFGGGSIADLSLYLVIGIITGCYSTVFIASPVVLAWERWREGRLARAGTRA